MAEPVNELPPKRQIKPNNHRWDEWLDGRVWKFVAGVDYENENTFDSTARIAAQRRGLRVAVRHRDGEVYLQAYKPSEAFL